MHSTLKETFAIVQLRMFGPHMDILISLVVTGIDF